VATDRMAEVKTRLVEIEEQLTALQADAQRACDEVLATVQQALEKAHSARKSRTQVEDLRAEALFLRLQNDLPLEFPRPPETRSREIDYTWKEVRSLLQPVRPSVEWLEKIREVEESQKQKPVLTENEREELLGRLKDNVCPICVNFALDGTCTLESFDSCPIDTYLNRMVRMIEQLGHRPWMEDYFERMYREICPGCQGRTEKDYCPPREEGECSLFNYLPTVVRTIESFLEEREASRRAG